MFNLPSLSRLPRAEGSVRWGHDHVSMTYQDAPSLRCPGYLEKQDEQTAQILLEGSIHILTDFQSFQRRVLKIIGGLIAYTHCFLLILHR